MKDNKAKKILSIESSTDETAAAVLSVEKNSIKTLSAVVKSQIPLHAKMGGVVPEAAARAHIKNIRPVVEKSLVDAKVSLDQIDYIAVTHGPGLIPSLIVGVEFAKALALGTGKPLIPINHMAGHLYSPFGREISNTSARGGSASGGKYQISKYFPAIALIVSGGHTMLVLMKSLRDYKVIGQTVDDAAGEAFDKVAKLLGLPYPGGPEISRLAEKGNPRAIAFPRPMINSKNFDFSFSGLKTAVLYYLRDYPRQPTPYNLYPNICASFQQAVIDVLVTKTLRAAKQYKAKTITLSGGVSANKNLRQAFNKAAKNNHLQSLISDPSLATDNAEMIGLAAAIRLATNKKIPKAAAMAADPNLQL